MKLRNKTRSDAAVVPYTHSATRITWSVNGYVKGARLYAVFCDVCGKEAGLRSVGEINRCKRSSLRLLCSDQCRKRIPTMSCKMCKAPYTPRTKKGELQKFCKKECYSSWQTTIENKGSNHPNWDPLANHEPLKHSIRHSKEWRMWRTKVYTRDNFKCMFCSSTSKLEPHHIIPRRVDPSLIFDISNGITLCRKCHQTTIYKEHLFAERCNNLIAEAMYMHK